MSKVESEDGIKSDSKARKSPRSSPRKSPEEREKKVDRRKRPAARLKTVSRLASLRKARAVKVLRNAKATRSRIGGNAQSRPSRTVAPSKNARTTTGRRTNGPTMPNRETKVYVGNLPEKTKKIDLEREFRGIGRIRDVWLAENPPGFAFVNFILGRDAAKAVREMDGKHALGCRLRVEIAKSTGRKTGSTRTTKSPRDRNQRTRSRDRSARGDRRLSGPRRDRLARPGARKDQSRSQGRDRSAEIGRSRDAPRSRLGARGDLRRSPMLSNAGGLARKGKRKKGGKGKKKRLARLRGRNNVPPASDTPQHRSFSASEYAGTPELRLGSPPRRGSGYDLPPPPPLLPLPPVDLYDVFDSRYRNMEINRYRDDPNYSSGTGNWAARTPSPMRNMTHTYYARTPSPRPMRGMPRTPPSQRRRSVSPLPRHGTADPRKRPQTPPKTYSDPYSLNDTRYDSRGGQSPAGASYWNNRNYNSPPRRPPSPPPLMSMQTQWHSPTRDNMSHGNNAQQWNRSPPAGRQLPSASQTRGYAYRDSAAARRSSPQPLAKGYVPYRRSPSPLQSAQQAPRRHSPLPDQHAKSNYWQQPASSRYRSPSPRGRPRTSPSNVAGRGRSPPNVGHLSGPRSPVAPRGHSPVRRPRTPPGRPRSPPPQRRRSFSRSPPPKPRSPNRRRNSPSKGNMRGRSPARRSRSPRPRSPRPRSPRPRSPRQRSPGPRSPRQRSPRPRSPRPRSPRPRSPRPRSPRPRSPVGFRQASPPRQSGTGYVGDNSINSSYRPQSPSRSYAQSQSPYARRHSPPPVRPRSPSPLPLRPRSPNSHGPNPHDRNGGSNERGNDRNRSSPLPKSYRLRSRSRSPQSQPLRSQSRYSHSPVRRPNTPPTRGYSPPPPASSSAEQRWPVSSSHSAVSQRWNSPAPSQSSRHSSSRVRDRSPYQRSYHGQSPPRKVNKSAGRSRR